MRAPNDEADLLGLLRFMEKLDKAVPSAEIPLRYRHMLPDAVSNGQICSSSGGWLLTPTGRFHLREGAKKKR